ncbi:MAG: septal ring lytic transglycosylase RlpA family protein [Candidatus Hydrogenedentes bacterium]|nr:septal ring lytic transglycosylase RlpA family protein [Candidatus Hydrogenedentota bacterium]
MFELIALMILSQQPVQPCAEGIASFYTVASSSTLTASGESLRDDLFTCAMLEGEFGHYYLVLAENGNSVVCKLNDRGPYVKNRVIDLSLAAMRILDGEAGLLKVQVFHLGPNPPPF